MKKFLIVAFFGFLSFGIIGESQAAPSTLKYNQIGGIKMDREIDGEVIRTAAIATIDELEKAIIEYLNKKYGRAISLSDDKSAETAYILEHRDNLASKRAIVRFLLKKALPDVLKAKVTKENKAKLADRSGYGLVESVRGFLDRSGLVNGCERADDGQLVITEKLLGDIINLLLGDNRFIISNITNHDLDLLGNDSAQMEAYWRKAVVAAIGVVYGQRTATKKAKLETTRLIMGGSSEVVTEISRTLEDLGNPAKMASTADELDARSKELFSKISAIDISDLDNKGKKTSEVAKALKTSVKDLCNALGMSFAHSINVGIQNKESLKVVLLQMIALQVFSQRAETNELVGATNKTGRNEAFVTPKGLLRYYLNCGFGVTGAQDFPSEEAIKERIKTLNSAIAELCRPVYDENGKEVKENSVPPTYHSDTARRITKEDEEVMKVDLHGISQDKQYIYRYRALTLSDFKALKEAGELNGFRPTAPELSQEEEEDWLAN